MKIAAIRERVKGENRVAITPEGAQLYVKKRFIRNPLRRRCNFKSTTNTPC